MGNDLDAILEAEDKKLLDFLDRLQKSEDFDKCSDALKEKVVLYRRAFRGDAEAMIYLSQKIRL